MQIFGLHIERTKTRLDRERHQQIREMGTRNEPTRELAREIRTLREAVVREMRRSRSAARCVSVYEAEGERLTRCRLSNGHAGDHRSDGSWWTSDEEVGEAVH